MNPFQYATNTILYASSDDVHQIHRCIWFRQVAASIATGPGRLQAGFGVELIRRAALSSSIEEHGF